MIDKFLINFYLNSFKISAVVCVISFIFVVVFCTSAVVMSLTAVVDTATVVGIQNPKSE